jgi:hypothetical protein
VSIHSTGLGADGASVPRSAKLRAADFIKYATIADWELISGMRRTATYEALGCGNLRAIKLDNRTLIDVEHGLAWLATLPAAEITTGRKRGAAATAPTMSRLSATS